MKFWLLTRNRHQRPYLEAVNRMVVCAETEDDARIVAAQAACKEGPSTWLASSTSKCSELVPGDAPLLIVRDYNPK